MLKLVGLKWELCTLRLSFLFEEEERGSFFRGSSYTFNDPVFMRYNDGVKRETVKTIRGLWF